MNNNLFNRVETITSSSSSSNAYTRTNALLNQLQLQLNVTASKIDNVSNAERVIYTKQGPICIITINNPPVNSLHPSVQQGIKECYEKACADSEIKAVVITGAGDTFMAGADIAFLRSMQQKKTPKEEIVKWIANGHTIFNNLESGPKPTVAAINGQALGGGCELAMACNARVCTDSASFGLPELTLGIIPGLGGTQRFPRLIGLEKAVQLTLTSKSLKAKEALGLGLVDAVVKKNVLLKSASELALAIASGNAPRVIALEKNDRIDSYENSRGILEMARANARKKNSNLPQPLAYVDAVEAGLRNGGKAGLEAETDLFATLVNHPVSKASIHFFFASRSTSKVKGIPDKPSGKPIQTVAVLGGGTMGAGICIIFLTKGYNVILKEINDAALAAGVKRIVEQVQRVMKSRKMPAGALEMIMRNLKPQTTYAGFDKVDLVIEAVLEKLTLKQQIFEELEKVCGPTTIFATNTSTIDIEKIGSNTKSQDRIIGLHYFSPAHIMPLLEIIRTRHTSPEAIAQSLTLSKRTGKTPVVVGNCVGFGANRGFFPYGQSACFLVDAGVNPYDIDSALEKFGMPMGLFRMSDLSGIDISMHVNGTLNEAYGARCYNSTLIKQLAAQNRLGQKTGAGYYKYVKGKPVSDAQAIAPFIEQARKDAKGLPQLNSLSQKEIVEIVFFPVVNEFLRIISEKHIEKKEDADVLSVFGYGYPAWRGGILFWAENEAGGWSYVHKRLQFFSQTYGATNSSVRTFFAPCDYLTQLTSQK